MAKTFRMTSGRRLSGRLMTFLIERGLAPPTMFLLSVPGRKTGRIRFNPVDLVILDGKRWLVAPYGEVGWVRNARAAGKVVLARRGSRESVRLVEVGSREAAPVLREYISRGTVSRPYFDVSPNSPAEDFVAEAPRHPVFEVV